MTKRSSKWAIGTLLGALAGYIMGILTAPKSGKETRQDIHRKALKAKAEAEKKLKDLHSELNDLLDSAKSKAGKVQKAAKVEYDKAVERAGEAREKARTLLSALHEGDSGDHDLQKAIDEAKSAAQHLKSYIDKHEQDVKKAKK